MATPDCSTNSVNVYAKTAKRRGPGRPRTRPDVMRPSNVAAIPTSIPDLEDLSLGGLLRRTVYNFIQTGKYDDIRFLIQEKSLTGGQISERLKSQMDTAITTYK